MGLSTFKDSLVQSDKTDQWFPIRIINYIVDMEIHICCYCNKIDWSQLDRIYIDTTTIVDEIEDYCSEGEANFLRSWVKTKKIPSVCLSSKDHKATSTKWMPFYPSHQISTQFTQCLSKLASKSIKCTFRHAGVYFKRHTLKNLLALKLKLEEIDKSRGEVTIVSLGINDLPTVPLQSGTRCRPALCKTTTWPQPIQNTMMPRYIEVQYGEHNHQILWWVLLVWCGPRSRPARINDWRLWICIPSWSGSNIWYLRQTEWPHDETCEIPWNILWGWTDYILRQPLRWLAT